LYNHIIPSYNILTQRNF